MLNFIKKTLKDLFCSENEHGEVIGSKRVPHDRNFLHLEEVDTSCAKDLKRHMSQFNTYGEHDPSLPTLLIVDDCDINSLYGADFQMIKVGKNIDIYKLFNIYQATGCSCGVEAVKFINNNKIDYAILDLTLGNFCKLNTGSSKFIEIDGVDLGIAIKNKNPDVKMIFSTAHIFNTRYPEFQEYIDKFESNTTGKFITHYLNKLNDDRTEEFCKFLGLDKE